jgi:hypothetical protein
MSPSDLKHLKAPAWIDADRQGAPILMLFSVVDDRSGVAYQEYRCVYGEDVETALRFLFNAMSSKPPETGDEADPFQGIPAALSLDNGPVAKSAVFKRVMESLGVEILPHMPAGSDGRRTTARAKGKVERPFRTVKDARTRRSTISMNPRPKRRRTAGSRALSPPTIAGITGPNRMHASTTGWRTCPPTASGKCAPGSGSAPSRASRSGAWSALTAV